MSDRPTAFVIMPFGADFKEVYEAFLMPTLQDAGFTVRRADDLSDQRSILRDILELLHKSSLVVADLTNLNPNVFYELGIAHAFGQRVILLTQDIEELPFDLRSYRVIQYDTHFHRIEEAKQNLHKTAGGALRGTITFGSPISDYMPALQVADAARETTVAQTDTSPDRETAPASSTEEPGWLDRLDGLVTGYDNLTSQLHSVNEATAAIGTETQDYSARLHRINSTAGRARTSAARALASQYGRRLEQYGEDLSAANSVYETVLSETQNSIEFIISRGVVRTDEDETELRGYLQTLRELISSADSAGENLRRMRMILRDIEGIESGMTRAARVVGNELDRFVGNIEQTVAAAQRGVEIGEQRLTEVGNQ